MLLLCYDEYDDHYALRFWHFTKLCSAILSLESSQWRMAVIGRSDPESDSSVKVALRSEADIQECPVCKAFRNSPQSAMAELESGTDFT